MHQRHRAPFICPRPPPPPLDTTKRTRDGRGAARLSHVSRAARPPVTTRCRVPAALRYHNVLPSRPVSVSSSLLSSCYDPPPSCPLSRSDLSTVTLASRTLSLPASSPRLCATRTQSRLRSFASPCTARCMFGPLAHLTSGSTRSTVSSHTSYECL
ncbi:uncharacterized protein C8Q71DRAFT_743877 [Rhodofomes roseus]|uniref:Uncharacterized protein n=1 Tax=Rhodofomes roseus TaxID=34475 RepID=A0ABQ8KP17_9APHY|nr:uncharacterized protein C8Q71DRAFT_743877 [Rhodofomes roseus]KAH9839705.1 hypothetical protein C8Q71DRAFT_743877 [Rhodofomes roseus]